MTRARFVLLFVVVSMIGVSVPPVVGAQDQSAAEPEIRLQGASFAPAAEERPTVPPGLEVRPAAGGLGDYIVQFEGPITQKWASELDALGVDRVEYLPDFAYRVVTNPGIAARMADIDGVAWVGPFEPAFKLSPAAGASEGLYTVRVRRGVGVAALRTALEDAGAQIVDDRGSTAIVWATPGQVEEIAHLVDVSWIEPFHLQQTFNEYGAGAIAGAATANANGYDGSTQVVAIADTGLGNGFLNNNHRDIDNARVVSMQNWFGASQFFCYQIQDDGGVDVSSGHGTHVAGSAVGSGGPNGEGRGAAPGAGLVFQAVENYTDFQLLCEGVYPDGYYLIGIPSDLNELFGAAYDRGARIHSNSWGSTTAGDYTADSAEVDTFVWSSPDMMPVFAAGNDGIDADGDGVVDSQSIASPGTAKNAITVGASENDRNGDYGCDAAAYATCSGQNAVASYGEWWPADFPADPIAGDPAAGDAEQMAAFSSRGPTADGRIKPDVVAPGTWVLSSYSDQFQQFYDGSPNPVDGAFQYDGWGDPYDAHQKYFGGTSMATPIVAGSAAVVRDFYEKTGSHAASAALVKASLVNSAVDLADENNDGAHDNDFPIPNVHEGWGRIDVAAATDGTAVWVDDASGLTTGASATHTYDVAGGSSFKVTLAWSDYPAAEAAAVTLVNDLDLIVTAPDGTQYRGNTFSGGWSTTGGAADRANNLENVYVAGAQAGTWTVEVIGHNVPFGPQPFALVVDGGGAAANTPPEVTITAPADGSVYTSGDLVSFTAVGSDAEDGDLSQSINWASDIDGPLGSGPSLDTAALSVGTHVITASVADSGGASAEDSISVTVEDPATASPVVTITAPEDGSVFTVGQSATFTGSASDAEDGDLSGAIEWSSSLDGGLGTGGEVLVSLSEGSHLITASVTDSGGATETDTITVVMEPAPNTPPAVAITSPADGVEFTQGGSVSFAAAASDAEDGDISGSIMWFSDVDGALGTGASIATSTLSLGTHVVTASVTDSGGSAASDTVTVTINPSGENPTSVSVADLLASSTRNGGRWTATVTAVVEDNLGNPVEGATVTGVWSTGDAGECVTDSTGTCEVSVGDLRRRTSSVQFTVTGVTSTDPALDYVPTVTSVTVNRP